MNTVHDALVEQMKRLMDAQATRRAEGIILQLQYMFADRS